MSVKTCKICGKLFFSKHRKRRTCSDVCMREENRLKEESNEGIAYLPSPEEIALQCALIRAGLAVSAGE